MMSSRCLQPPRPLCCTATPAPLEASGRCVASRGRRRRLEGAEEEIIQSSIEYTVSFCVVLSETIVEDCC